MKHLKWIALGVALIASLPAQAQDYPSRVVTMIVPFSAGGPADALARVLAQSMTNNLKQQVIVENVTGAGGTLGAARVAKADPDGYTLLFHHIGMATSLSLYRKLSYKTETAFEPIGLVTDVPMVLVGKQDVPASSFGELIPYVKEKQGDVLYAHAGIGSSSHLCGLLFMRALEAQMTTVPYKGTGPAMTDLLGGQVDLLCDHVSTAAPQIKAGKIKPYAVTTLERVPSLPDVPTADEAKLKGFQLSVWYGLYAPKGTERPVVDKLVTVLQQSLQDPQVVQRFADLGTAPVAAERATPKALQEHLTAELARWHPIIEAAGVYAE
jgi:tripartite-type tricarboxylate transporter receptor subunit TctC